MRKIDHESKRLGSPGLRALSGTLLALKFYFLTNICWASIIRYWEYRDKWFGPYSL